MSKEQDFVGSLLALFKRYDVEIDVNSLHGFYIISDFFEGDLEELVYPYVIKDIIKTKEKGQNKNDK